MTSRRRILISAAALFALSACGRKVDSTAKSSDQLKTTARLGSLEWAVAGDWRPAQDKARDRWRHPVQTLTFFGLKPGMTVVEFWPGAGWYTDILAPYLAAKGSITVDGVSLTVGALDDAKNVVTLWLIPETLAKTNLSTKKIGDLINIEVDILAKYVERLISKGARYAD